MDAIVGTLSYRPIRSMNKDVAEFSVCMIALLCVMLLIGTKAITGAEGLVFVSGVTGHFLGSKRRYDGDDNK